MLHCQSQSVDTNTFTLLLDSANVTFTGSTEDIRLFDASFPLATAQNPNAIFPNPTTTELLLYVSPLPRWSPQRVRVHERSYLPCSTGKSSWMPCGRTRYPEKTSGKVTACLIARFGLEHAFSRIIPKLIGTTAKAKIHPILCK